MEDTEVVDILDVSLLEAQSECVLLSEEVERVEGFCMCFGDGWDVLRTWEAEEPCEEAASVLNGDSLRGSLRPREVVQKWSKRIWGITAEPIVY